MTKIFVKFEKEIKGNDEKIKIFIHELPELKKVNNDL